MFGLYVPDLSSTHDMLRHDARNREQEESFPFLKLVTNQRRRRVRIFPLTNVLVDQHVVLNARLKHCARLRLCYHSVACGQYRHPELSALSMASR
jgi:hypothetical protein